MPWSIVCNSPLAPGSWSSSSRSRIRPEAHALVSLEPENGAWRAPHLPGRLYVFCANAEHGACNWLVPHDPGGDPY